MSVPITAAGAAGPDVQPGTVPAWAVVFLDEERGALATVGSDTYHGSVSAALPADLTGGRYEVVVEGMTDADYEKIHSPGDRPLVASIHLWWKDAPTGVFGDLARFTGLDHPLGSIVPDPPPFSRVALIRVDRLWRRAGPRRFEVVVNGRELVTARLADTQADPIPRKGLLATIGKLTDDARVDVRTYGLDDFQPPPGRSADESVPISTGTALQALTSVLEIQARRLLGLHGQPLAVIRDGVLHVGVWANSGGGPRLPVHRVIDDDSGLLAVERGAARPREQQAGTRVGAPTTRLTLKVTALGRPDLKPGDTLELTLPPEDFPKVAPAGIGATLLNSLASRPFGDTGPDPDPTLCRITEVSHQVSREQGFLTVVGAFVLADGDDGWDLAGPRPVAQTRTAPPTAQPAADPAQSFATRLSGVTAALTAGTAGRARSRVGLVHDHSTDADDTRHTSDFWYATTAGDGGADTARTAEVTPDLHAEAHQVPYVTPFAWGNYGLVLPRYPATRVLLVDGAGAPGEYVDVGALWPRGAGPAARPGDYWLALPVAVQERQHLPPDGATPSEREPKVPDGPATHDLIDSDGARVIETTRFVLRVAENLTEVPQRPDPESGGPVGSVLIETKPANGTPARILLRDDGSVAITAGSITFDAGQGEITLKARDVRVELAGGTMDVS